MAKKADADGEKSLLGVAWTAYQAGDQVVARRAAQLLLAGASKDADEAQAKKIGKELFVTDQVADAKAVAAEILLRTRMPPKPFLLAAAAGLIWLVLMLIATRS